MAGPKVAGGGFGGIRVDGPGRRSSYRVYFEKIGRLPDTRARHGPVSYVPRLPREDLWRLPVPGTGMHECEREQCRIVLWAPYGPEAPPPDMQRIRRRGRRRAVNRRVPRQNLQPTLLRFVPERLLPAHTAFLGREF